MEENTPDSKKTTDKYTITYISTLVGMPTSQLANVSEVFEEFPPDLQFLVSHNISENATQFDQSDATDTEQYQYEDARLKYNELSARIYNDIPVSDMMRKDEYQFAFSSHTHPFYTWFKTWPDFGANGKIKDHEISGVLATVHYENNNVQNDIDICLPKIDFENKKNIKPRHLIGELMFVHANSYNELTSQINGTIEDIYDENFSGWVVPDGKTFLTKRFDFMEAKLAFGQSSIAGAFTVPNFAGFVKPTGNKDKYKLAVKQAGHNNVPVHTHSNVVFSDAAPVINQVKSASIAIKNGRASKCGKLLTDENIQQSNKFGIICPWPTPAPNEALPAAVPVGYKTISDTEQNIFSIIYNDKDVEFGNNEKTLRSKLSNIELSIAGTEYNSEDEENTMSWPNYTAVPVLIYVGFPDNSKYKYWE